MEVPKEVLKAAAGLVKIYGPTFSLLGRKDGFDVFIFCLPEDEETGFPFVFLYAPGKPVKKVTCREALALAASFGVE